MNSPKDDRLRKSSFGREPRGAEDPRRNNPGTSSMSAEHRRELLENFNAEALPNPPRIPGWHLCWLSTTSQYDPLHKRERMGYVAVKASEIEGFDHMKVRSGEQEGLIKVNEMILYKLPEDIYQAAMQEMHHFRPQEEERMLAAKSEQAVGSLKDSEGNKLVRNETTLQVKELPVYDFD